MTTSPHISNSPSTASRTEIAFVLDNLPDFQTLVSGLRSGVQVVVLDSTHDALAQMVQALQGQTDLAAIHLLSHGAAGRIDLGSLTLSSDNLNDYQAQLAQIGASLALDGDLLVYGCDVAQGANGQMLVNSIARLTQADVAASDDLTGASALGGNWVLETKVGRIESALALGDAPQLGYGYLLANIAVDHTDDGTGTGNSLRDALFAGVANSGTDSVVLTGLAIGATITLTGSTATVGAGDTIQYSTANGTLTIAGNNGGGLDLAGVSNVFVGDATSLTISADISGNGSLNKTGGKLLILSGTNTYSGGTTISGAAGISVAGGTNLGTGLVTVNTLLTVEGNETIGSLAGGGTVALNANSLTVGDSTSTTFSGAISGTGSLIKTGSGTLTLEGGNTFTGESSVSAGTLLVNRGGDVLQGAVTVASGATLAGSASIAGLVTANSGSTVTGGTSATAGSLALNGGLALAGSLSEQIGSTTAGTGYDQFVVTGAVNLTGASLNASFIGGFSSTTGDSFTLLDNDASDAVIGTFSGLVEGATFSLGDRTLKISYSGGSNNNDVVLTDVTPAAAPAPTITSATYDAATGTLVVTGTDFVAFAGSANDVDVTQLAIRGEGGSLYHPGSSSDVEITSSTEFTVVLSADDKEVFNSIINKDGTTATGGATYSLTAGANFLQGAATTAGTAQALTVSHIPVPTITSATYAANTGVLVVTGIGLSRLDGSNNDILANKLQFTGQAGGTYTLTDTGDADMASTTSFTMTLSVTDKAAVNALLNQNGTSSLGGTTFNLAALEDWDAAADGALTIADLTGNSITVSSINTAPTITNLGGDTVALPTPTLAPTPPPAGVTLDSGTALTIADTENDATNWNGASLTVQRIRMGGSTADPSANDVFSFNASGITATGGVLKSGGQIFATYTNTGGVLSISFTGTGTNATNTLVQDVMRGVRYANNTPYGDATLRFTLSDGTDTTNADVTVTSSIITVDRSDAHSNGDDSDGDAADGFSLREALARGVAQTGADTLKLTGLATGSTITLAGSAATLGGGDTLDYIGATGKTLVIASSTGGGLTLTGASKVAVGGNAITSLTISADISGVGSLEKLNPRLLVLSGNNSYSGGTLLTTGLTVSGGTNLGTGLVTVNTPNSLTLNGNETIGSLTGTGTVALTANSLTLGDSTNTTFSGVITGTGGVVKTGSGTLTLSGTNTYTGTTTVSAGTLVAAKAAALGTTPGDTTVSNGAALALQGSITVAEAINLTGTGISSGGALINASGTNTLSGAITLAGDSMVASTADTLTLSGVVSGAFNLAKAGSGKLILSGANTYTGTTTVLAGELNIESHNNISSGNVLLNGGMLSLTGPGINDASGSTGGSGFDFFANNIAIGAAGGNLFAQNAQWFITGALTGSGALTSSGDGILILDNASGLTGPISISDGLLEVSGTSTLGSGQITFANNTQLYVAGVTKTLSNNIVLAGNATLATDDQSSFNNLTEWFASGATVTFSGAISESGGARTLTLTNTTTSNAFILAGANTYTGGTVLSNNTKVLVSADANLGVGGNVTLNAGSALSVTADATLNHAVVLAGAATLEVGSGVAASISGVVSGGNDLSKAGAGVLTLSGTNTYTGTTTVNAGTLWVDGTHSGSGAVSVASGATLGGTGSIAGAVTIATGATLSAGTDTTAQDLSTGNLVLGGTLSAQIGSTNAGTGYDQLAVTGSVNLSGSTLEATFISGFTSATGNSFTLIDNDASDGVTGTFSGLAEGATLIVGGRTLKISYMGGTGNDVVLTDVTATVNTPPVLDVSKNPSLPSVSAKASNPAGITVANLVADDTITDADGSAVKAIAITALDTRLGAWQYSLDNGSSWLTLRADLINSGNNELALLLGPTAQVRLLPFGGLSGTLSEAVTFRAWDMSNGAQGDYTAITGAGSGTSAFSSAADSASITVTAVNDAPTFAPVAGSGKAVIVVGNYGDTGQSIAVQPDGKIIVAGYSEKSDYYPDFSLIRLNADGTLDTSFAASTGGKLLIPIGSYHDRSHSVAVQADGKIVVAGEYTIDSFNTDFGIVRLNTDGTLDSSFAGSGKAVVPLSSGYDYGNSLAIQPDGKIILAGNSLGTNNGQDFSLIRLNVDGRLDTSFDGDGKAIFAVSPYAESGSSVTVQADGKIILAGSSVNLITNRDFSLIRLNADGSLDTTFGDLVSGVHTGKAIIDIAGSTDDGRSLTVQADGKFILAGNSYSAISKSYDFSLVRLNADGSLDTSFGTGGKYLLSVGNDTDQVTSVVVQPDGNILFAGSSTTSTPDPRRGQPDIKTSFVTLVRLTPDGVLDSSFGTGGITSMSAAKNFSHGYGLTVQPDGKIVVGYGDISTVRGFGVMRLDADGSLDATFNGSAANTLGTTAFYTEDGLAVALDTTVAIFDADLAALNGGVGNYNGASITLMRHEGGNTADVFSAMGNLSLLGGAATLTESGSPVTIGTFTNTAGTLAITFNSLATQARVNTVLSSVGYANTSHAPPASVQIDWTFSDGNTGDQGDGGALTAADITTVTITAVNDAPTISGVPVTSQAVITGTAAALVDFTVADMDGTDVILNVTLSATNGTINGLVDTNLGTPGIQLNGTAAAINTALAAATFTAAGAGAASIAISVEDGQVAPVTATYNLVASAVVVPTPVNSPPTGSVTISGTAAQGQTLTAANTLADLDGLGAISYQWQADGSDISGAMTATFTLTQAEVGKAMTAVARYTDAQGTIEVVASSATAAVANVNDAPTGSVTISGTAAQGKTLTAANTLADLDGLGTISYQWQADGSDIAGANSSTLVLSQDQVGKAITTVARYTDGANTAESVSSSATAVVANVNDLPTGSVTISGTAAQGQTLTAANTLADLDGLGTISYQWQADGSDIAGATSTTFTLTQAEVGKAMTAVARYTDAQGTIESVASSATTTVANLNDAPTGSVTISGTAAQGQTLTVTNTLADLDGLGVISYQWQAGGLDIAGATATSFTLTQAEVGKTMTAVARYNDAQGALESVASGATAAVVSVNSLPTGSVTISGTATQGQTLTAANTLADLDGLGTISYQWQAGGVDISGATATSFTLTQAEVGKAMTAVARYTDAQGTIQSVASSATAAVANVNDLPNGSVTLSGTAIQGQTLTVTNTLADLDGLGAISYQWQAGGLDITGATATTFTLTQAEVGKAIAAVARYTDAQGTMESVASSATATVAKVADLPPDGGTDGGTNPGGGTGGDTGSTPGGSTGGDTNTTIEDTVPSLTPVTGGSPVAGDGNGDGIPDSQQVQVTSFSILNTPTAQSAPGNATALFVSLVAGSVDGKLDPASTSNVHITRLVQQDAPAALPAELKMPQGLLNFSVSLQPNAGNSPVVENFSLYVDASTGANGYWVQNAHNVWCNLASAAYGGKMVLEGGKLRLDFKLMDGGEFDTDGLANGSVSSLGAAASMPLSLVGFTQAVPDSGFWF